MADDIQPRARNGNGNGMNWGAVVAVVALVGLAAGVGYNFKQVADTQEWQKRYDNEYVRRDVQEQQLRQLDYKLEDLRGQIQEIKGLIRAKVK